ncbi:uncharacterized protein LOC119854682 isoform X2 [Dermochelys coriacea]|nr:uncharacterized protein LOC119854682 isoform X2 [Dermochelys coriacea]
MGLTRLADPIQLPGEQDRDPKESSKKEPSQAAVRFAGAATYTVAVTPQTRHYSAGRRPALTLEAPPLAPPPWSVSSLLGLYKWLLPKLGDRQSRLRLCLCVACLAGRLPSNQHPPGQTGTVTAECEPLSAEDSVNTVNEMLLSLVPTGQQETQSVKSATHIGALPCANHPIALPGGCPLGQPFSPFWAQDPL